MKLGITNCATNPGALIKIDATGKGTVKLLEEVMMAFNAGNRATFLWPAGEGERIVQRIRVELSRIRRKMDRKNKPYQQFNLRDRICPHTHPRTGIRFDCIVLEKVVTDRHKTIELIERMLPDAKLAGNAGKASEKPAAPILGDLSW